MSLGQNGALRYGHFSDCLELANLGLIDFKLGLYIKTFGQNGHKLAQNRPDATLWQEH